MGKILYLTTRLPYPVIGGAKIYIKQQKIKQSTEN